MNPEAQAIFDGGNFYVYGLVDPILYQATGSQVLSVFYVGKGLKERVLHHQSDQLNELKKHESSVAMEASKRERIRMILGSGYTIPSIILASGFTDEDSAYKAETLAMELIGRLLSAHGMQALTNAIPGHGQSRGMAQTGRLSELSDDSTRLRSAAPERVDDEPEWLSVDDSLKLSTSRRAHVSDVLRGVTILVKGTAEALGSGHHPPVADTILASGFTVEDSAYNAETLAMDRSGSCRLKLSTRSALPREGMS